MTFFSYTSFFFLLFGILILNSFGLRGKSHPGRVKIFSDPDLNQFNIAQGIVDHQSDVSLIGIKYKSSVVILIVTSDLMVNDHHAELINYHMNIYENENLFAIFTGRNPDIKEARKKALDLDLEHQNEFSSEIDAFKLGQQFVELIHKMSLYPHKRPLAVNGLFFQKKAPCSLFSFDLSGVLSECLGISLGKNSKHINEWLGTRGRYLFNELSANDSESILLREIQVPIKEEENSTRLESLHVPVDFLTCLNVSLSCLNETIGFHDLFLSANATRSKREVYLLGSFALNQNVTQPGIHSSPSPLSLEEPNFFLIKPIRLDPIVFNQSAESESIELNNSYPGSIELQALKQIMSRILQQHEDMHLQTRTKPKWRRHFFSVSK